MPRVICLLSTPCRSVKSVQLQVIMAESLDRSRDVAYYGPVFTNLPGETSVLTSTSFKYVSSLILPLCLLLGMAWAVNAVAQEEKHKIPVIDKLATGSSHQAFSGRVLSFDKDRHILNVNTVQGGNTEIFPVKKGVRVSTADGERLKLKDLSPGTNVLIYFEQRREHRTVTEIVVLGSGASDEKKKPGP